MIESESRRMGCTESEMAICVHPVITTTHLTTHFHHCRCMILRIALRPLRHLEEHHIRVILVERMIGGVPVLHQLTGASRVSYRGI